MIIALPIMLLATSGCAKLGYSNRVLHQVPSPDGRMVAVCQERPEFDGPGYRIRLHHPNGRVLQRLYEIGDGRPCDEVVWAPDGKTLGVLSSKGGELKLVDVEWARAHPSVQTSHHSWREVYLGDVDRRAGDFTMASGLRFPDSATIEVRVCSYSLETARDQGIAPRCNEEPVTHLMPLRRPIFEKLRHESAHPVPGI